MLDRYGANWPLVFAEFEKERKDNTDAIADMAIENFTEMRDRVADSRFLFRKKVELALEARYPRLFVPKYSMVTFHRIPYSVALARGAVQDRMLAELCEWIPSRRRSRLGQGRPVGSSRTHSPGAPAVSNCQFQSEFQSGEDFAIAMDATRSVEGYRERFLFPKTTGGDCVYLCGHSLGLQPRTAAAYIEQELKDWAELGVEGHFHAKNPWMPYHRLLCQQTAELVGAKPIEVVVMNSLTVNLHLMMVSFYRPTAKRYKIVVERGSVPFRPVCDAIADSLSWI